jgi:hypothetical protein
MPSDGVKHWRSALPQDAENSNSTAQSRPVASRGRGERAQQKGGRGAAEPRARPAWRGAARGRLRHVAQGRDALRARRFHFLEIYNALTSKPLKRLRRTNKRRRASAIDRLTNWFLGCDTAGARGASDREPVQGQAGLDRRRVAHERHQGHQELGPVGGAAPPVCAARPERGLHGGAQQRALHVDQVRMLRRAQPQGVQEQAHQLPPSPKGRPQLPAAAVLTPHLLKMRKVSQREGGGR